MKFLDTKGREHKIDIRPSKWRRKDIGEGRGKYQSEVGQTIADKYPHDPILEEFPCKGEGLFLDFFLPRRMFAVEVQGSQHSSFNSFFHSDITTFKASQARDKLKEQWCKVNGITLIKIEWGTKMEDVLKMLP